MKLYIDDKQIDIEPQKLGRISLSLRNLTGLDQHSDSKIVAIDDTPGNRIALGTTLEANSAELYNATQHKARIESDGVSLVEGDIYLLGQEQGPDGSRLFRMQIAPQYLPWLVAANVCRFSQIEIPFSTTLSQGVIINSWSGEAPVRFLPVLRHRLMSDAGTEVLPKPTVTLTYADYHPFIHIGTAVRAIVQGGGYTISSEFMQSEMFDKLYISGNYPSKNVETIKASMDFLAGRFSSTTAKADYSGKVWVSSLFATNSVGNIVNTADPTESVAGVKLPWAFSRNGCFSITNNVPTFKPLYEITASMLYQIRYRTDYIIQSRSRLKGFDIIALDDGVEHTMPIPNPFEDRREALTGGQTIFVIVFEHVAGSSYQFRYTLAGGVVSTGATFTTRTTKVTLQSGAISKGELWRKLSGASTYSLYASDWAIYDGYVTERGAIDVEVNLTSQPKKITPASPLRMELMYIRGAESVMSLTMLNTTRVMPVFDSMPAQGTKLNWSTVAAHDFLQIELLRALQQLFNLAFYCDTHTKTLYIEPMSTLIDTDNTLDWSNKIDFSQGVQEQLEGSDAARTLIYGYKTGDRSVEEFNQHNDDSFARWQGVNINSPIKGSKSESYNSLFTATITNTGGYPYAQSAYMIAVGDTGSEASTKQSLNFAPKIVSYQGVQPLPKEQRWGWPSFGTGYPMLLFNAAPMGVNLCFEDRGAKGLNQFYGSYIRTLNNAQRLTVHLNLTPDDIAALLGSELGVKGIFRAVKLRIDGEYALFSIDSIDDINTEKERPTKVTLTKIV